MVHMREEESGLFDLSSRKCTFFSFLKFIFAKFGLKYFPVQRFMHLIKVTYEKEKGRGKKLSFDETTKNREKHTPHKNKSKSSQR